jgi:hypothetical protein
MHQGLKSTRSGIEMKNAIRQSVVAAAACLSAFAAMASNSIDTTPSWNGITDAFPFGAPDTATFGQSISTDGAGGVLGSFTFYLSALDLDIRAYVFSWDGLKAVGPALFTGPVFNLGSAYSGFAPVTINTGAVALAPNSKFVLLLTSSGLQTTRANIASWGALRSDAYNGGEFVLTNSGNDLTLLSDPAGWDCPDGCGFFGTGVDLAFKAQISPMPSNVPEPGAGALMLMGVALTAAARLRRA